MARKSKDLKWFNEEYKKIGYSLDKAKSGHLKVRDPNGRLVTTLAATPSDHRGLKNAQAHLKRHERARQAV